MSRRRRIAAIARRNRVLATHATAFLAAYQERRKPEDYWRVPELQAWMNWRTEWMMECLRHMPEWSSDPEQYPGLNVAHDYMRITK